MGASLAHLLHSDTTLATPEAAVADDGPARVPADQDRQAVPDADPVRTGVPFRHSSANQPDAGDDGRPAGRQVRLIEAQPAAAAQTLN